ncbi:N-acetyl-gamma-glutamyl-phosphate reductase [Paludibacter propionicigenes WB4]|uniref:N-acetyl-gamma-glutamyl-phosphate reductase n=1 Tax=Paludibacter propionicigenes (strain DSM 17365 / JCM 13257 / WB4) TaxID=694427 RepID=E4T5Y2_PALPW|nr:N-acetyl-gamma-glutamyl-phosphate reductase [Paludibacter propionicigenes]ADQ80126.1 N-acetyl-gamma-glutamyl-phosphate reductase [Paludibacter propionicigenes WB4]
MTKIKVGVIGGAGYTAGELLRILIHHPAVEIVFVNSSSNAGNPIADVHSGLFGETDLVFTSELPFGEVDALFLCSAHGDSKKFMDNNEIPASVKIIDLSTDYRAKSPNHDFVYGLPELNRSEIIAAKRIANPGCFATAIQLALLPLAAAGLLTDEVHVNAITGSTGAGVKPSETSHFSWRNNNISIYKPFGHQHLSEIGQSLRQLQTGFTQAINFIPVRGNFARGIYATTYTKCSLSLDEAKKLYTDFYKDAAFTFVSEKNPDMKQVVNTNKAIVYLEKHEDKLLIVSMIDNLLKGASGQAVQNMNLMFGLDEKSGLGLKSTGF